MKKLFFIAILAGFLAGCGGMDAGVTFQSPPIVTTATPAQCPYGGSVISTSTQMSVVCNGAPGSNGTNGTNGHDGSNGTNGSNGYNGSNGATGATGPTGTAGAGYVAGLNCDVYSINQTDENGTVNWDTLLSDGSIKFTTTLANFNVANQSSNDIFASFTAAQQALIGNTDYALDCSGNINVPETAMYTFTLGSDDGSEVAIDNNVLINMPVLQPMASKTAQAQLFAGEHKINVLYFQGPATNIGLQLMWQGPANAGLGTSTLVPSTAFTH